MGNYNWYVMYMFKKSYAHVKNVELHYVALISYENRIYFVS